MKMTKEELLLPRYKVIANYPSSPFTVGMIMDKWNSISPDIEHYGKYPAVFKRLEWWEERNEKDMPEYVRCAKKVLKVTWQNDPELKPVEMSNDINNFYLSLSWNTRRKDVTPASEEEFIKHNTP